MNRLIPALAASLLLVLFSPFIGELRNLLKATLPGSWVPLVAAAGALAVAGALVAAVAHIRDRRAPRFGALVLSALLFVFFVLHGRTGSAEVDAVQLFHFVEYGLITLLFYRAFAASADLAVLLLPALSGFLVGILEEWLQWFVPDRTGDLGDVWLNLYAVSCGLVFSLGLQPPERFSWRLLPTSLRRVVGLAAIAVLALAGFFHSAHTGYEIQDDDVGRFRSYFTADELSRLEAARAVEWRDDPPVRMAMLGKQDYFLTEGGWHAQLRNEAYAARDFRTAWFENRILEEYFDAFLSIRSFSSGDLHRWAPAQRDEVSAGLPGPPVADYVSRAGEARIYLRPTRTELWSVALAAALALAALSRPRAPPGFAAQRRRD